jgi:hypothetical protein
MDEPDVWVGVPLRGKDNPHGGSDTERYRWHRHDHVKLSDIGVSIEHHPACRSLRLAQSNANQFPPLVAG